MSLTKVSNFTSKECFLFGSHRKQYVDVQEKDMQTGNKDGKVRLLFFGNNNLITRVTDRSV